MLSLMFCSLTLANFSDEGANFASLGNPALMRKSEFTEDVGSSGPVYIEDKSALLYLERRSLINGFMPNEIYLNE